ncbi:MAG: ornithine cyclodeaminase family protein [Acidimicrobiia bacterium]|nr:ornithine cyclodeaminase family protein [Acidimicrobiia bacterium]
MTGSTKLLGAADVAEIVRSRGVEGTLDELIERLRDALGAHDPATVRTPARAGFHYERPALGLLEWMPAMELGRVIGVKTVGYHPANPTGRGLPSIVASTALYDPGTGALVALVDATLLTALRTGAASAIATDILARPGPTVLGVIGCGAQAVAQVHAISRVRPLEAVLVHDSDPEVAASFARRTAFLDRPVHVLAGDDRQRLLAESDVLCTATSVDVGAGPVVADGEHKPWLHVNAIGADFPGKCELPRSLLARALVCPDVVEQCRAEGELQQLDGQRCGPDLPTLVQQRERYEPCRDSLTVFDSTGWAVEDLVAAELAIELAGRFRIGQRFELHAPGADPHDPYEELV